MLLGESGARAGQFGCWLGAWVWASLQAELPARFFASSHSSPDLSKATVNKKVVKIFLFSLQSTGGRCKLMRY